MKKLFTRVLVIAALPFFQVAPTAACDLVYPRAGTVSTLSVSNLSGTGTPGTYRYTFTAQICAGGGPSGADANTEKIYVMLPAGCTINAPGAGSYTTASLLQSARTVEDFLPVSTVTNSPCAVCSSCDANSCTDCGDAPGTVIESGRTIVYATSGGEYIESRSTNTGANCGDRRQNCWSVTIDFKSTTVPATMKTLNFYIGGQEDSPDDTAPFVCQGYGGGDYQGTTPAAGTFASCATPGKPRCDQYGIGNCPGAAPLDCVAKYSFAAATTTFPIELISFTGKAVGRSVVLNWATASEEKNAYFELEHSFDGSNFQSLTKVTGNGTTTEQSNYTFTDNRLLGGINYYRIKQYDTDGKVTITPAITVYVEVKGIATLQVAPNPAHDRVRALVASAISTQGVVNIYDVTGRLVHTEVKQLEENRTNAVDIPTSSLANGVYFVQIKANNQVLTQRFMVQH